MKRKLMWLTALGAVAALAYAQTITIRGAIGQGLAGAPDSERPNAHFSFSVRQAEHNGQSQLGGSFAIEVREANRLVTVLMPNAQRLSVDIANKRATFSGPAVAVLRTRQGVERARGVVVVRVEDNRSPRDTEGSPDTIAVAFFTNPDSEEPAYTFRGTVRRGDIVVFEETRSR
jgi:hypothetical protein